MKAPDELFIIVVASVAKLSRKEIADNKKLKIEPYWKVGEPVVAYHNAYGGDTFGLHSSGEGDISIYTSREQAEYDLEKRFRPGWGITLEIVTYIRK